jgi:hypothetical protein
VRAPHRGGKPHAAGEPDPPGVTLSQLARGRVGPAARDRGDEPGRAAARAPGPRAGGPQGDLAPPLALGQEQTAQGRARLDRAALRLAGAHRLAGLDRLAGPRRSPPLAGLDGLASQLRGVDPGEVDRARSVAQPDRDRVAVDDLDDLARERGRVLGRGGGRREGRDGKEDDGHDDRRRCARGTGSRARSVA